MSNANLIVSGSIHQGDCHSIDASRGRQCAFKSLSALFICANWCCVSQWMTNTINQISIQGDTMHLKCLENQTTPDADIDVCVKRASQRNLNSLIVFSVMFIFQSFFTCYKQILCIYSNILFIYLYKELTLLMSPDTVSMLVHHPRCKNPLSSYLYVHVLCTVSLGQQIYVIVLVL